MFTGDYEESDIGACPILTATNGHKPTPCMGSLCMWFIEGGNPDYSTCGVAMAAFRATSISWSVTKLRERLAD